MARSELVSCIKILIWYLLLQTVWATPLSGAAKQNKKIDKSPATARSLYEQYTLGKQQEGAKIIYTYQYTQSYDEPQQEISLDFHYPYEGEFGETESSAADNPVKITQIELYVRSQDGSDTQAFVTAGGIGENNISLQVVAAKTDYLNYMLVMYGKAVK